MVSKTIIKCLFVCSVVYYGYLPSNQKSESPRMDIIVGSAEDGKEIVCVIMDTAVKVVSFLST